MKEVDEEAEQLDLFLEVKHFTLQNVFEWINVHM